MSRSARGEIYLGIEGGATRTVAIAATADGALVARTEHGPANLRLLKDTELKSLLRDLRQHLPKPQAIAIGLAGAWTPGDRQRLCVAAGSVWPGIPCYATHDLETALATTGHSIKRDGIHQVLIVSGTGSCCYGQAADGQEIKVGGWGHILGDKGSGYEIGLRALKATVFYFDRDGVWPRMGTRLLRALQLNEPNDLIGWAQSASKNQISQLAVEVFAAWAEKEKLASDILAAAANSLARDGVTCARRVLSVRQRVNRSAAAPASHRPPVEFVLAGSNLLKQRKFAALVTRELKKLWPGCTIQPLTQAGVWGAVKLAQRYLKVAAPTTTSSHSPTDSSARPPKEILSPAPKPIVSTRRLSPTELRNPRSMKFDRLSLRRAIEVMLSEDAKIPKALLGQIVPLEQALSLIVRSLKRGGRLFYVGAGTSGRLGVLDASECPPTFRTSPELVQGIIAGGEPALRRSIEGAEDDVPAGARAMQFHDISLGDVVVGIAASGTTPFVWGALQEAKARRAKTILLCFNPFLDIPRRIQPSVVIAPNLGPEVLTGSTRLKAGTATKLVLNIFTTVAMVHLGKVMSNLMIDLNPANVKLRDRATRIVCDLVRVDYQTACKALEQNGWVIKKAVARLSRK